MWSHACCVRRGAARRGAVRCGAWRVRRYFKVTGMQSTIDRNIYGDDKYSWANSPVQKEKPRLASQELGDQLHTERFNKLCLVTEMAKLRSTFGDDAEHHPRKFVLIEPSLTALEKAQQRFNKMDATNLLE